MPHFKKVRGFFVSGSDPGRAATGPKAALSLSASVVAADRGGDGRG
jgi:hypothetical protein